MKYLVMIKIEITDDIRVAFYDGETDEDYIIREVDWLRSSFDTVSVEMIEQKRPSWKEEK